MNKKEYNKQYYEINKDKIKNELSKKIHCDVCNKDISIWNINKHSKTNKHKLSKMSKDPTMLLQNKELFDELVKVITDNIKEELKM